MILNEKVIIPPRGEQMAVSFERKKKFPVLHPSSAAFAGKYKFTVHGTAVVYSRLQAGRAQKTRTDIGPEVL